MKNRLRMALIGAAALSTVAFLSAAGAFSAGAATTGYSANVTTQGLNLSLFGTELVGGNSTACVNQGAETSNTGSACDGKSSPYANAKGSGTLLTSSGLYGAATSTATTDGQNDPDGSEASPICSPLSSGGPVGASGVTLEAGAGCGWSDAAVDANGNPSASATGEVAEVDLDLNGILSQITNASPATGTADLCTQSANQTIGALLNAVCQILGPVSSAASSTPVGGLLTGVEQALQNLDDIATHDLGDLLSIKVGPAESLICQGTVNDEVGTDPTNAPACDPTTDGTVTTYSQGDTLQINALNGVGCSSPSLATCATDEVSYIAGLATNSSASDPVAAPLLQVNVGPAQCTAVLDPTTGQWTSTDYGSVVDVHLNIPGDPINLDIPGTAGTSQEIAAGTPLQSTISIASGSSAPVGTSAACNSSSVTLNLLQSGGGTSLPISLPGSSSTPGQGLIYASLGTTALAATNTSANAPITSPSVATVPTVNPPAVVTAPATAVPNVTTVHTGEFWSGSLPIILMSGMGLAGIVLIVRRRVFSAARTLMPFARHAAHGSAGGPPPGPASGTSSVPPPVSGPARRQPPL
jgi:hypothetical protein